MISVEEIEPQEQEAVLPAPEPEVIEPETVLETPEVVVEDVPAPPPLEAAPKKRGRPKAAPKEKPMPKPKGRPKKVIVPEQAEEVQHYVPQPTDDQLHEYVTPLLRLYASHLMRGREGKRAHYRNIFSRM